MSKKQQSDVDGVESGEKKHFVSKYDPNALRECIRSGMAAKEIQDTLGLGSRQVLKQHVLKLSTEDKTLYEVPDLFTTSVTRPRVDAKGMLKLSLAR